MPRFIKRTIVIAGRQIPALQIGPATQQWGTRQSDGRPVLQTVAECLSLRTTNPLDPAGNPQPVTEYLTSTTENLRFTPLRFDTVVGLDVDEHGAEIDIAILMKRMADNIAERQVANIAAQAAQVVSLADALIAEENDGDHVSPA